MNMMLLAANSVWNWVLIGVVALLLIAMPVMMSQRNKKESQKLQEQTNSLKVGDKVLTTSGVYGTITELKFDDSKKLVVIETGGKVKSYLTVDAYAIYTIFKSDEEIAREEALKADVERREKELEEEKKSGKKSKDAEPQPDPAKAEGTKAEEPAKPVVEPKTESKPKAKKTAATKAEPKTTKTTKTTKK